MPDRGYIKLYRALFKHEFFRPGKFSEREAFAWLLAEAAPAQRPRRVGQFFVQLRRGQIAASVRQLAGIWGWGSGAVCRFLERCKREGLLTQQSDAGISIITICNYDVFSDSHHQEEDDPDLPFFSVWQFTDRADGSQRQGAYVPAAVRRAVLQRDGRVCRYCTDENGPFHFDHKIPWSKGGLSTVENIVVACETCNLSKGARTPEQWMAV